MSLETQEHPKNKRMAHRDVLNKCKTFARVSKSLCAEIAVYRSRNFVLLERRSLRIDRLTQIPHHFGCKFDWVSKSRSSQRIFVSFFHLPKLFRYVKIFCKQRFTNNDGINSVIFSKSLLAECIVNAKGLLKLILHFFLTYSYFLHSFLSFL